MDEETKQAIRREVQSILFQMYPDIKERADSGTSTEEDLSLLNGNPRYGQYPALVMENFRRARPRTAALLDRHGLLEERSLWIGMLMHWRINMLMEQMIQNLAVQPQHMAWRMQFQRQAEEMVLPSMLLEEVPNGMPEPEMASAMKLVKARLER